MEDLVRPAAATSHHIRSSSVSLDIPAYLVLSGYISRYPDKCFLRIFRLLKGAKKALKKAERGHITNLGWQKNLMNPSITDTLHFIVMFSE